MSVHQFISGSGTPALAIQSPQWWRAKYSLASDAAFFGPFVTANSYDHYTLGLGVCGNARMGKAVDDSACYDRAYSYLLAIVELATPQAGGFLGWLSVQDGNVETSLREVYCWRFAPELLEFTRDLSAYASQWAAVKDFLETNIWTKWYSRGVNANLYRSVIHIAAHWAKLALWLRTEGSTSAIRAQAEGVLASIDHVGMPNWSMASMRTQLIPHPVNPEGHFWRQFWTGTQVTEPFGSDVAHGEAFVTYASEAIRAGYDTWSVVDAQRFLVTKDIFWAGATNWEFLVGPTGTTTWAGKYVEYGTLGQFDRGFQAQLEADEARGVANGSEKWGTFALNAARLGAPYL